MIVPSRATLVSGQDAPGAVAELGDPGMHSRLGARGTLLGLPQSAQLLGAPRALSPPRVPVLQHEGPSSEGAHLQIPLS